MKSYDAKMLVQYAKAILPDNKKHEFESDRVIKRLLDYVQYLEKTLDWERNVWHDLHNDMVPALEQALEALKPYGGIQVERQAPDAVWLCVARVDGKRTIGFSLDGPVSKAYRQYVPVKD